MVMPLIHDPESASSRFQHDMSFCPGYHRNTNGIGTGKHVHVPPLSPFASNSTLPPPSRGFNMSSIALSAKFNFIYCNGAWSKCFQPFSYCTPSVPVNHFAAHQFAFTHDISFSTYISTDTGRNPSLVKPSQ